MRLSLVSILAFVALARSRSHARSHAHVRLNQPTNKGEKRAILDHMAKALTYLTPTGTSRNRTDVRMELGERRCGVCQFFGASWLRVRSR
jgi:hypothetical protein